MVYVISVILKNDHIKAETDNMTIISVVIVVVDDFLSSTTRDKFGSLAGSDDPS